MVEKQESSLDRNGYGSRGQANNLYKLSLQSHRKNQITRLQKPPVNNLEWFDRSCAIVRFRPVPPAQRSPPAQRPPAPSRTILHLNTL